MAEWKPDVNAQSTAALQAAPTPPPTEKLHSEAQAVIEWLGLSEEEWLLLPGSARLQLLRAKREKATAPPLPSEEEIARAICHSRGRNPDELGNFWPKVPCWKLYCKDAQGVLTLLQRGR